MLNHWAYGALAFYAASLVCYARILYVPHVWLGRLATILLISGLVFHYYALLDRTYGTHMIPYDDLFGSMSLFAWLLGVTYLGLELFHRQRTVGAFVALLLFGWTAIVSWLAPREMPPPPPARGPLFAFHVTLNTWAYAAFALSFVLSIIYLFQDHMLRSHKPGAAFWRFPALDVLDRMSRSSVYVGLVPLAIGVVGGFVWEHRLTGDYALTDPKVIITLAIVAAYIAYLYLSRSPKWRGARAATVCIINFCVVLFSYTIVNRYFTGFHRFY